MKNEQSWLSPFFSKPYLEGRFDEFKSLCEVVYLERTPSISTTEIIEIIKE